ncbi:MAG: hypothetical protein ABMA25_21375, partial [Ilumatobacteraceae bacterium]
AQAAVARAISVGDVIAIAIATTTYHAITGLTHPAFDERTQLGDGWQHLVRRVVSGGSDAPVSTTATTPATTTAITPISG